MKKILLKIFPRGGGSLLWLCQMLRTAIIDVKNYVCLKAVCLSSPKPEANFTVANKVGQIKNIFLSFVSVFLKQTCVFENVDDLHRIPRMAFELEVTKNIK